MRSLDYFAAGYSWLVYNIATSDPPPHTLDPFSISHPLVKWSLHCFLYIINPVVCLQSCSFFFICFMFLNSIHIVLSLFNLIRLFASFIPNFFGVLRFSYKWHLTNNVEDIVAFLEKYIVSFIVSIQQKSTSTSKEKL